jgi:hypothetical protein
MLSVGSCSTSALPCVQKQKRGSAGLRWGDALPLLYHVYTGWRGGALGLRIVQSAYSSQLLSRGCCVPLSQKCLAVRVNWCLVSEYTYQLKPDVLVLRMAAWKLWFGHTSHTSGLQKHFQADLSRVRINESTEQQWRLHILLCAKVKANLPVKSFWQAGSSPWSQCLTSHHSSPALCRCKCGKCIPLLLPIKNEFNVF